jgi:hypothetical protein
MTKQQKIITACMQANLASAKTKGMQEFCREQLEAWLQHIQPKQIKPQPSWDKICADEK